MKGYKKTSGWLYQCLGGPLANQHIRGYNIEKRQGVVTETTPDWDFYIGDDDTGRYVLTPVTLASGAQAMVRRDGIEVPAFDYVWTAA